MRQCPYCAEDIKDAAIKCKHCGEMLGEPEREVTSIVTTKWGVRSVVLESDGSRRAFLDVIVDAVEAAGFPVTERSYSDFRVCFESRGISWSSNSGDVVTINLADIPDGSRATLTAKGKPTGLIRLQLQASAMTWASRILPGFAANGYFVVPAGHA